MQTPDHNPKAPENAELAQEAAITKNSERQQELATHPSAVVRWHLAQNKNLSTEAIEALGGLMEVTRLQKMTKDAIKIVDKN